MSAETADFVISNDISAGKVVSKCMNRGEIARGHK